jgi:hypothetical protein
MAGECGCAACYECSAGQKYYQGALRFTQFNSALFEARRQKWFYSPLLHDIGRDIRRLGRIVAPESRGVLLRGEVSLSMGQKEPQSPFQAAASTFHMAPSCVVS